MALIPTLNKMGYTTDRFDWVQSEFLNFLKDSPGLAMDVGSCFGFACQEALNRGFKIIAMDIEQKHLDHLIKKNPKAYHQGHLKTLCGRFPDDFNFNSDQKIGAILLSRIIHFLRGEELVSGLNKAYRVLSPGGKIFIETMTPFIPMPSHLREEINKNILMNKAWPGELEISSDFCKKFEDQIPSFLHVFDQQKLERTLESSGFVIEKYQYYTPVDTPSETRYDGREAIGLIGVKKALENSKKL